LSTDPVVPEIETNAIAAQNPAGLTEELKDGLDRLDLLLADLGQINEFSQKATSYVDEARSELQWNKVARAVTVILTLIIIFVLLRFLHTAMATDHFMALANNPNALAVLIGGAIGGTVVLAIGVTRAVHSTFAERNAGMPMPEHLKTVIDAVKTIVPSGH
jgi:hypothetical protein